MPAEARHDERRSPADDGSGDHVARVVQSERDPGQADQECRREEEGARAPGQRQDRERDRECRGCVVARERRVGRRRREQVGGRAVRGERARAVPHVRDDLVRRERDGRRGETRERRQLPLRLAVRAREEPEPDRRGRIRAEPRVPRTPSPGPRASRALRRRRS